MWLDTSIFGSMAFATAVLFLTCFLLSPKHGMVSKWLKPAVAVQNAESGTME